VIDLHPAVVDILGGTNDVARNKGATSLDAVESNLKAMVEIAKAHHIRVVIGAVPPARSIPWRQAVDPVPSIKALNA
jgi:lysophospholipase L1-like esterase